MKNTLAVLALCAAPLLAQASNCTGDNADGNYILGEAEGTASAMHWPTGLVWKRCIEGETFSNGACTTGGATEKTWHGWATDYLPKYFADSGSYPHSAPNTQNLLASGAWRMAYKNELVSITQSCGNNPKINRTVFPDTPSSYPSSVVWSGSPYAGGSAYALSVDFSYGDAGYGNRSYGNHVRLVRAGQSFASLNAPPITQNAAAGDTAVGFTTTITLASAAGTTAWGGVRFQNGSSGNPQLQVNSGAWVTQAIVKTGDIIAVRMNAPASGGSSHTATLTVRSGQTTGTNADGSNGGDESTKMEETTATFTLNAIENGACGSAHNPGILLTSAPTANLCNAGAASPVAGGDEKWSWTCDGSFGGSHATCEAPRGYTVTPTVQGTGGSISPAAPQTVAYGATPAFTLTPNAHHASAASGCGGSLSGSQFTTAPVAAHCTVNATFTPIPGQCGAAHGGTFATAPSANLCGAGTPSPVTRGAAWTWSCAAATTANCSASVTTYAITTSAQPPEGGTVDCTPNPVQHGSGATCTATAQTGYTFTGFGGACAGASCSLANVTSAQTVSASFSRNTYAITTSAQPPEGGAVDCTPNPVEHGSGATCTATAQTGYTFASFGGACTGASCSLANVTSAQNVSASFSLDTYAITASAEPAEAGRVVCAPNPVPHGGSATCKALSNAYRLAEWAGDCAGQSGPVCTLTGVTAPSATTARFDTHAPIPGPLNDTGAFACDASGPATRDCHHGRDAGAATGQLAKQGASSDARNGFDFTKIAGDGAELQADAADWACTRDNLTGLVWEVKTAASQDATYTWHDPHSPDGAPGAAGSGDDTASFVAAVNATGLCGAHDWRLPTVPELAGLLDLGRAAPAARIDPGYFPHGAAAGYWTRTPFAGDTGQAWQVDFASGTARPAPRGDALRVRLVRGGQ